MTTVTSNESTSAAHLITGFFQAFSSPMVRTIYRSTTVCLLFRLFGFVSFRAAMRNPTVPSRLLSSGSLTVLILSTGTSKYDELQLASVCSTLVIVMPTASCLSQYNLCSEYKGARTGKPKPDNRTPLVVRLAVALVCVELQMFVSLFLESGCIY